MKETRLTLRNKEIDSIQIESIGIKMYNNITSMYMLRNLIFNIENIILMKYVKILFIHSLEPYLGVIDKCKETGAVKIHIPDIENKILNTDAKCIEAFYKLKKSNQEEIDYWTSTESI